MFTSCSIILLLLVTHVDCRWDPIKNPKEFAAAQKQNAKKEKAKIKKENNQLLKDFKAGEIESERKNEG